MKLTDIKTLKEVALENKEHPKTLQARLKFLEEGDDYKLLGERMPTLLSPSGQQKILKKYR